LDESLVEIQPEGSEEIYYIQHGLLFNASEYFHKALDGRFLEGFNRRLTLPGCDEDTLKVFLYWVVKKELPWTRYNCCLDFDCCETPCHRWLESELQVIRVWRFADQYLMPKLQNAAMSILLDMLPEGYPQIDAIHEAFSACAPDSRLCKMYVDEIAFRFRTGEEMTREYTASLCDAEGFYPEFFMSCTSMMRCHGDARCSRCLPSDRAGNRSRFFVRE
jgi:hypothetical protein